LTEFIEKNLKKARYKILEDGSYFGEIPGFKGVWANGNNLEKCRKELKEVLEEWLVFKIKDNDRISGLSFNFSALKLNTKNAC